MEKYFPNNFCCQNTLFVVYYCTFAVTVSKYQIMCCLLLQRGDIVSIQYINWDDYNCS